MSGEVREGTDYFELAAQWRARAREKLPRCYWRYVGALVLQTLTALAVILPALGAAAFFMIPSVKRLDPALLPSAMVGSVLFVLLVFALYAFVLWGQTAMSIATVRGGLKLEHAFSGWGNIWRLTKLLAVVQLSVFFRLLCLIVPGIIAIYSYALAGYIQVDHPDWSATRCMNESARMMEGHRMELFCLQLSFFGWQLLVVVFNYLCGGWGFGGLLLTPYVDTAKAVFYEEMLDLDEGIRNGRINSETVSGETY